MNAHLGCPELSGENVCEYHQGERFFYSSPSECLSKGTGVSNLLGLLVQLSFGKKCSEFPAADKWKVPTKDSESGVRIRSISSCIIVPVPDNK